MSKTLKCPYCLFEMSEPADHLPGTIYTCVGCHQDFQLEDALPGSPEEQAESPSSIAPPEEADEYRSYWIVGWSLAILGAVFGYWSCGSIKGPEFINLYFWMAVGLLAVQWVFILAWDDQAPISSVMFLVFESVGVARFLTGYFLYDMRNFGYLAILMMITGVVFFLRMDHMTAGGIGGCRAGGCGSCSSCGGGCGGGCGGCGG